MTDEARAEQALTCPASGHEIRRNEDGSVDEVVGWGFFHLEQMDNGHWWLGLDTEDGRLLHVSLHARGRIKANAEDEGDSSLWARRITAHLQAAVAAERRRIADELDSTDVIWAKRMAAALRAPADTS